MALKLINQAGNALGQFDGLDTEVLTLKGGEVVTFASVVATSATDKGARDVFDGYVPPNKRVVVTKTLTSTSRPLMLADDGIVGYGTLFGTVVGGVVGQGVTGAALGPHTASGSGKVTCWDKPGVYGVSLDACDTAADGLKPSNASVDTGVGLTYTAAGLLTPVGSTAAVADAPVVGRFIDFQGNGSLVTTPASLVGTLNPPDGSYSAASPSVNFAVFYFNPPAA
jgi:outer membrane lipoprotein SlyB